MEEIKKLARAMEINMEIDRLMEELEALAKPETVEQMVARRLSVIRNQPEES